MTCMLAEEANKSVAYPFNCMYLPNYVLREYKQWDVLLVEYLSAQLVAAAPKLYAVEASNTNGAVMLCLTYCNSQELCHADLGLEIPHQAGSNIWWSLEGEQRLPVKSGLRVSGR